MSIEWLNMHCPGCPIQQKRIYNKTIENFHNNVLSTESSSKSRLLTVLSSAWIAYNTSFTLETNLVGQKLLFHKNCIILQSSTQKFLGRTLHASFPNSVLLSIAVLFRAQAVIQGESAFPNKCTVILSSVITLRLFNTCTPPQEL